MGNSSSSVAVGNCKFVSKPESKYRLEKHRSPLDPVVEMEKHRPPPPPPPPPLPLDKILRKWEQPSFDPEERAHDAEDEEKKAPPPPGPRRRVKSKPLKMNYRLKKRIQLPLDLGALARALAAEVQIDEVRPPLHLEEPLEKVKVFRMEEGSQPPLALDPEKAKAQRHFVEEALKHFNRPSWSEEWQKKNAKEMEELQAKERESSHAEKEKSTQAKEKEERRRQPLTLEEAKSILDKPNIIDACTIKGGWLPKVYQSGEGQYYKVFEGWTAWYLPPPGYDQDLYMEELNKGLWLVKDQHERDALVEKLEEHLKKIGYTPPSIDWDMVEAKSRLARRADHRLVFA